MAILETLQSNNERISEQEDKDKMDVILQQQQTPQNMNVSSPSLLCLKRKRGQQVSLQADCLDPHPWPQKASKHSNIEFTVPKASDAQAEIISLSFRNKTLGVEIQSRKAQTLETDKNVDTMGMISASQIQCVEANSCQIPYWYFDDKLRKLCGGQTRVLLVEDAEINRLLARRLIRGLNIELEEAENGKVAVDFIKVGKTYDLILMDKEMPVMDGHQATRQLRLLGVTTPIVALSGDCLQIDRDTFFEAGADDFKPKPLSRDVLFRLLANFGLNGDTR